MKLHEMFPANEAAWTGEKPRRGPDKGDERYGSQDDEKPSLSFNDRQKYYAKKSDEKPVEEAEDGEIDWNNFEEFMRHAINHADDIGIKQRVWNSPGFEQAAKKAFDTGERDPFMWVQDYQRESQSWKFGRNESVDEAQGNGNFNEWFQAVYDYADANLGMSGRALSSPAFMKQAKQAFKAGDDPYSFMSEYAASRAEYTFGEAAGEQGFGDPTWPAHKFKGGFGGGKLPRMMKRDIEKDRETYSPPSTDCPTCLGQGSVTTGPEGQSDDCPDCGGVYTSGDGEDLHGMINGVYRDPEMPDTTGPFYGEQGAEKDDEEKGLELHGEDLDEAGLGSHPPFEDYMEQVLNHVEEMVSSWGQSGQKLSIKMNKIVNSGGFQKHVEQCFNSGEMAEECASGWVRDRKMHEAHGENAARKHSDSKLDKRSKAASPQGPQISDFGEEPDDTGFGNKDDQYLTGDPDSPERGEFDQKGGFSAGGEGETAGFEDPTSSRSNPEHGFGPQSEPSVDPEDPLWHGTDIDPEDTDNEWGSDGRQVQPGADVQFPEYDPEDQATFKRNDWQGKGDPWYGKERPKLKVGKDIRTTPDRKGLGDDEDTGARFTNFMDKGWRKAMGYEDK